MPTAELNVLAPNYMGDLVTNRGVQGVVEGNSGVESLTANYGYGVLEMQKAITAQAEMTDQLRTAKAREFGKTKDTVGF
jgi:hypothetical protein